MSEINKDIESHYGRSDLGQVILDALAAAGKDTERIAPEDLAPIDEFHVRGREATVELAGLIGLEAGQRVLDVGSGLGGASRHLASAFGCRVTGLDLTEAYCLVAEMLAERTGLDGLVEYRQGNALAMPFADGEFDVVWSQHAAMNIPDKPTLYSEMARVLKPGGRMAIYDVMAGQGGEVVFPVPWAREPSISFLATPPELRNMLEGVGLTVEHWRDTTGEGRDWFRGVSARIQRDGLPPLGFHVMMGPEFAGMAGNQLRNLEEDRIALIETICRKR